MKTILVVDDYPMTQRLMATILQHNRYKVITANDGNEALEQAAAERPDLILMDLEMPDLDGWSTIKAIKQRADLAHIPIFVVTGQRAADGRDRAIAAGCDQYLVKPVNLGILGDLIRQRLTALGRQTSPEP